MTGADGLYASFIRRGSYLNRMLQCGQRANFWLEHALTHMLPTEIFDEWKEKVAFVSTANSDAFRIASQTRLERELIFISEHIIPPNGVPEDHPDVRYFLFVALHEMVHVVKQHKPPNEISEAANNEQEAEADQLAFDWFNSYVAHAQNSALKELTKDEREAAARRNTDKQRALQ